MKERGDAELLDSLERLALADWLGDRQRTGSAHAAVMVVLLHFSSIVSASSAGYVAFELEEHRKVVGR